MLIESYPNYDPNFFTATFMAAGVFWIVGFIVAAMLMVVLRPIFKVTSLKVSLALFLAIGFIVPFGLGYLASSIGAHGNPSSLEANWYRAMGLILIYSFIGALSAFTGWSVLRKRLSNARI